MYKLLSINGKDYKLEYTIEASLYDKCVESTAGLLAKFGGAAQEKDTMAMINGIANIPQTALTVFYAGLLEAHGTHPDGDGRVPDIETAKKLLASLLREHKDDELGDFYGVFEMCLSQMEEDGFLKLAGLETVMETMNPKTKKSPKKPMDHQKKVTEK